MSISSNSSNYSRSTSRAHFLEGVLLKKEAGVVGSKWARKLVVVDGVKGTIRYHLAKEDRHAIPRKVFTIEELTLFHDTNGPRSAPFAFELYHEDTSYSLVLACENGSDEYRAWTSLLGPLTKGIKPVVQPPPLPPAPKAPKLPLSESKRPEGSTEEEEVAKKREDDLRTLSEMFVHESIDTLTVEYDSANRSVERATERLLRREPVKSSDEEESDDEEAEKEEDEEDDASSPSSLPPPPPPTDIDDFEATFEPGAPLGMQLRLLPPAPTGREIVVLTVKETCPCDLKPGDVLLKIQGEPIPTPTKESFVDITKRLQKAPRPLTLHFHRRRAVEEQEDESSDDDEEASSSEAEEEVRAPLQQEPETEEVVVSLQRDGSSSSINAPRRLPSQELWVTFDKAPLGIRIASSDRHTLVLRDVAPTSSNFETVQVLDELLQIGDEELEPTEEGCSMGMQLLARPATWPLRLKFLRDGGAFSLVYSTYRPLGLMLHTTLLEERPAVVVHSVRADGDSATLRVDEDELIAIHGRSLEPPIRTQAELEALTKKLANSPRPLRLTFWRHSSGPPKPNFFKPMLLGARSRTPTTSPSMNNSNPTRTPPPAASPAQDLVMMPSLVSPLSSNSLYLHPTETVEEGEEGEESDSTDEEASSSEDDDDDDDDDGEKVEVQQPASSPSKASEETDAETEITSHSVQMERRRVAYEPTRPTTEAEQSVAVSAAAVQRVEAKAAAAAQTPPESDESESESDEESTRTGVSAMTEATGFIVSLPVVAGVPSTKSRLSEFISSTSAVVEEDEEEHQPQPPAMSPPPLARGLETKTRLSEFLESYPVVEESSNSATESSKESNNEGDRRVSSKFEDFLAKVPAPTSISGGTAADYLDEDDDDEEEGEVHLVRESSRFEQFLEEVPPPTVEDVLQGAKKPLQSSSSAFKATPDAAASSSKLAAFVSRVPSTGEISAVDEEDLRRFREESQAAARRRGESAARAAATVVIEPPGESQAAARRREESAARATVVEPVVVKKPPVAVLPKKPTAAKMAATLEREEALLATQTAAARQRALDPPSKKQPSEEREEALLATQTAARRASSSRKAGPELVELATDDESSSSDEEAVVLLELREQLDRAAAELESTQQSKIKAETEVARLSLLAEEHRKARTGEATLEEAARTEAERLRLEATELRQTLDSTRQELALLRAASLNKDELTPVERRLADTLSAVAKSEEAPRGAALAEIVEEALRTDKVRASVVLGAALPRFEAAEWATPARAGAGVEALFKCEGVEEQLNGMTIVAKKTDLGQGAQVLRALHGSGAFEERALRQWAAQEPRTREGYLTWLPQEEQQQKLDEAKAASAWASSLEAALKETERVLGDRIKRAEERTEALVAAERAKADEARLEQRRDAERLILLELDHKRLASSYATPNVHNNGATTKTSEHYAVYLPPTEDTATADDRPDDKQQESDVARSTLLPNDVSSRRSSDLIVLSDEEEEEEFADSAAALRREREEEDDDDSEPRPRCVSDGEPTSPVARRQMEDEESVCSSSSSASAASEDLDDRCSSTLTPVTTPTKVSPAIGLAASAQLKVRERFLNLLYAPSGFLLEAPDSVVDVAVEQTFDGHRARVALKVTNRSPDNSVVEDLIVEVYSDDDRLQQQQSSNDKRNSSGEQFSEAFQRAAHHTNGGPRLVIGLAQRHEPCSLEPGCVATRHIIAECHAPFVVPPELTVRFRHNGEKHAYALRLPVAATCFARPNDSDARDLRLFRARWDATGNLQGSEQQVVVASRGAITREVLVDVASRIFKTALHGARVKDADTTPYTITAAAHVRCAPAIIPHTGALLRPAPKPLDVPVLLRLEANVAARAFRITVRSTSADAAAAFKNVLQALLTSYFIM